MFWPKTRLVRSTCKSGIFYGWDGFCPHCGSFIDSCTCTFECLECKKPVAWNLSDLIYCWSREFQMYRYHRECRRT